MKLEPLPYRSESPVQGMSDRQQESRGFNPVRKSNVRRKGHRRIPVAVITLSSRGQAGGGIGVVAQLVERFVRNEKVTGSTPASSTRRGSVELFFYKNEFALVYRLGDA